MRKVLLMFLFFIIILVGCSNLGYDTLEKAVQSHWDTPIQVVNQNDAEQLVYYLDNNQHVIGTFEYRDGKYFYDNKQSTGIRFTGLPFYIQYKHFEDAGHIVYGAIPSENHHVAKFVIHYENDEIQEIEATNNTFISKVPSNMDPSDLMSKIDKAYGYDSDGNLVESIEF